MAPWFAVNNASAHEKPRRLGRGFDALFSFAGGRTLVTNRTAAYQRQHSDSE